MNVPNSDGPHPVLILNHGYIDPAIYTLGRGLKREQDYFARRGYVVIHPDYRNHAFSSDVGNNGIGLRFGYTEDVVNLVKAVEESEFDFLDSENIGMLGHSMGGGITSNIMVALPDLVDAVVLYAPVSADYRDNFDKWTRGDRMGDLILDKYGDFEENPDFWDGVSPINYLDRLEVPVLLQQGTADESTPKEWADKLAAAADLIDADIQYEVYEGGRHEFIAYWQDFMTSNLEFFDSHLK
jgi:dipeptidyl aminopeptidase/acylaminoacyl peptidase